MDYKAKIRSRVSWIKFRKYMIMKANSTCELCGTKYFGKRQKLLNVHHMNESIYTYDDFNENNFRVLCSDCHDLVEKVIIKNNLNTLPKKVSIWWQMLLNALDLLSFQPYKDNYLDLKENQEYSLIDLHNKKIKNRRKYERAKNQCSK